MDEFKSEDELRLDSSDRHQLVPISRYHLIIGISILVLLLLMISNGSALKPRRVLIQAIWALTITTNVISISSVRPSDDASSPQ